MQGLHQKDIENRGTIIDMAKSKEKKGHSSNGKSDSNTPKIEVVQVPKYVVWIFSTILLCVVGGMALILFDMNGSVSALSERLENTAEKGDIQEVKVTIDTMEATINELSYNMEGDVKTEGVLTRLSNIEKTLNIKPIEVAKEISSGLASIEANERNMVTSAIVSSPTETLGTDNEGHVYIAKDMINKTILLTYTEGKQEVFFLGQYNEEYKWNGRCIINVYNVAGSLCIITDANYDAGKLIDYKQIIPDAGGTKWVYSERKCQDQVNIGKTFTYSCNYNQVKNFTKSNVKADDIYSAENFYEKINDRLLSYYSGNTSDGKYNDNTGNSFLINYREDGTISTLYVGNFVDGKYDDSTGNAWEIVFDSSNNINKYFFYKGIFHNGSRKNDEGIEYISQDDIDGIINNRKLGYELNWYEMKD